MEEETCWTATKHCTPARTGSFRFGFEREKNTQRRTTLYTNSTTSGCYFQVKRDERIIIQLSFIYTQMHITFTHNYTHSRTHTHTGAPKGGDGQNERPGGKLHHARDTTRGRTFPKTRCPSSVGGCTDREGISHFQYGHGGYILHPCTTHTTYEKKIPRGGPSWLGTRPMPKLHAEHETDARETVHNKLLHNQYTTLYTNGMAPHWPGSSRRRRNALIFTRCVLLCCNKQQHTHRINERTHAPG